MGQIKRKPLFENRINEKLITKAQLADYLSVTPRTINRLLNQGLGDSAGYIVGSQWRFDLSRALDWVRQKGR